MKKIITLLAALILVLTCSSCNPIDKTTYPWEIGEESSYNFADDNVRLTLDEETLTPTSGTFCLENHGEETIYYGEPFEIEIKLGNTWFKIIPEEGSFVMPEYHVDSNKKETVNVYWDFLYGELPAGTYRLVKDYRYESTDWSDPYYVCCEFTID